MVFVLRSVLRGLTWFRTNIVNVQFSLCEPPPPLQKKNHINRLASCHVTSVERNTLVEIWVEINAQLHSFHWQSCSSPPSVWTKCSVSTSPASHDTGSGQRETLTRSAARQRNSVLWHTGGFCTSLECLSDTKIFSLEQTVMHLEIGRLLRYVFMYRQYIYVYIHKVWRKSFVFSGVNVDGQGVDPTHHCVDMFVHQFKDPSHANRTLGGGITAIMGETGAVSLHPRPLLLSPGSGGCSSSPGCSSPWGWVPRCSAARGI